MLSSISGNEILCQGDLKLQRILVVGGGQVISTLTFSFFFGRCIACPARTFITSREIGTTLAATDIIIVTLVGI